MSSPSIQSSWAVVQDHSRVFRDLIFVYPVISRRSQGLSIGINLNPDKRCNFDCVYCEVDRRTPGRADRVDVAQLKDELRWLIRFAQEGGLAQQPKFCEVPELTRVVRDIAFSGDGEPTLIPNFSECVQAAIDVRHEFGLDQSKLVLITDWNAAQVAELAEWARNTGAPELAVPKKILKVAEVPVLGTGKTDYVTIQKLAEAGV